MKFGRQTNVKSSILSHKSLIIAFPRKTRYFSLVKITMK